MWKCIPHWKIKQVNFEKIIEELNSTWSPKQYGGTNMAPRKDFVPFSKKDQAGYNRQTNVDFPPVSPQPINPASLPFELNHIINDLSDSYIFLRIALKKISNACKNSKVLSDEQKKELIDLYVHGKKASKTILKIGKKIENVGNIAGQPTPDASIPIGRKEFTRN
jgi:hypothetical protein